MPAAQRAGQVWAAQGCGTQSAGGRAHHYRHRGHPWTNAHAHPHAAIFKLHGARPLAVAPGQQHFCGDAVLPQRDFDLTSGPQGPAGSQRQDGIRRRSLGKGRRVRSVIPAWRGQRYLQQTELGAVRHGRHGVHCRPGRQPLSTAKAIFVSAGSRSARPLAAPAPLHECRGLAEAVQELRAKRRAGNDALVERAVCDSLIHEPLAFEISAAAPAELELAPPDAADAIRHSWSCSPPNSKYGHPSATRIALVVRVAHLFGSHVDKEDRAYNGQPISYW